MLKVKFYIIISLLIFSINLSSATVGDELSGDIVTDTSFTSTPMSYSLEDPDFDFLHDWLNLIIELDVQNLTEYEFEYSIYDNATYTYLYGGNNYFDTTYYGIQSVIVPIEGHYFYDMGITGYIKIYVNLYETQNWTYLGQKEMVIWINSSDFELPPVIIDQSTITVTYYDIETNSNQTFPSGSVDLIFVDFIYSQQIPGYFEVNGHYYDNSSYNYRYSTNNDDWVEQSAGVYSQRLIFDSETLSNFGAILLDFSIYGSLSYNNSSNWYNIPNYNFQRTTTGSMFEAPIFTYEYYGMSFVYEDSNLLVDAFDIQFSVNARKSFEMDMYIDMEFFDGYDLFYTYSSNLINITAGLQIITIRLDATLLYGESPYNYFDLYFSGSIFNYWDTLSLHNNTYWYNLPITHPNYDKPVVYIENVTFIPRYNNVSTISLDGAGYDFLMINVTVSSKIRGGFNYYLDFYDEFMSYYLFSSSTFVDITLGTFTYTTYVDASLISSITEGNITLYVYGEVYDEATGQYFDDRHRSFYAFNSTDFNPTGYYVEPTTPVDPEPEPTDPANTDPTDPINTPTVSTNTTDGLNGTESTDASPEAPVLDLPAPSLYLSLLSIFTVVVILRKREL